MAEPAEFTVGGTALGIVVENYARPALRRLPDARAQLDRVMAQLARYGYEPSVLRDPTRDQVRDTVLDWRRGWEAGGGHGPAVVVWSGHGERHGEQLHLITHGTEEAFDPDQIYTVELLAGAALRSGADQILLIVDTCYSGAGVRSALERALRDWAEKSLPEHRANWLGVVASCQPDEPAAGRGTLLDTVVEVLRYGPATERYQHAWSVHNRGVTGTTVIDAVLAQLPQGGQRPLSVTAGLSLPMFQNPLWEKSAPPRLVEHLVLSGRAADATEEGWFFTGRRDVLAGIVAWLGAGRPGLFLVTGSAGSGKSAVLGRLATLSDPEQRAEALRHGALADGDPDPGEGSVDASVHLRGTDARRLAETLAEHLGLPVPKTPSALIADLEARDSPRPATLLLDGLDEAAPEQSTAIVEQLLVPLSRIATVLLGSRDRPFRPHAEPREPLDETLRRWLGATVTVVDLDRQPDSAGDLRAYAESRLRAGGVPEPRCGTTAAAVARRATSGDGGFLFTRLATGALVRRFKEYGGESGESELPDSIAEALADDLRSGPKLTRGGEEVPLGAYDLLTALAWSTGRGMPARGVWESAARAVSAAGTGYGPADVDWVLAEYGRYLVEDTDGTQAVYRLYHREFVDQLRRVSPRGGRDGTSGPALRVAEALIALLRSETDDMAAPERANPYLLRELPAHIVAAGAPGVELLRALVEVHAERFLPMLAAALFDLAVQRSRSGNPAAAIGPARESTGLYRDLVRENPSAHLPDLAASLHNLTRCLADSGDPRESLAPAREAVAIRRALAGENAAAHLPRLAASLNTLSSHLAAAGDRPAALAPAREAVRICHTLARTHPAAYRPELARSLNNLSQRLAETGDTSGALAAARESTELRRALAEENPGAHLPELARSLVDLGVQLAANGEGREALDVTREAAGLWRDLAEENPAAYLPLLAGALANLGARLGAEGYWREALEPAHEAVGLHRRLVERSPAPHLPGLALSLSNHAARLGDLGERHAALVAEEEATGIRRTLARDNQAAHLPDLALSLNNLGAHRASVGDIRGALACAQEAVDRYQVLGEENPAVHLPGLAKSLSNLAVRLAETGDRHEALVRANAAATIQRGLAERNPAVHLPGLAFSLHNLALHLAETGRPAVALAPAREAVDIRRTLVEENRAAHLPDLAMSLSSLAQRLTDNGDGEAGLAHAREALRAHRELAGQYPAAHLPALAISLNSLAVQLVATGNGRDALRAVQEVVGISRALAAENPAVHRLGLAVSLGGLAFLLADSGDGPGALAPAREAVDIRVALAQENPAAHLPGLAFSLNGLAAQLLGDGQHEEALAVYTDTEDKLAAHPEAARRIAFERALFRLLRLDAAAGVAELVPMTVASEPPGPAGERVFAARHQLRTHRALGPGEAERVASAWERITGTGPPVWLTLPQRALELAREWLDCRSWAASRAFWTDHSAELLSPEVASALREFALITDTADLGLEIVERAASAGPDAAFRPHLVGELLSTWLAAPSWDESRALLSAHAADLLQADAEQFAAGGGPSVRVHAAVLHLARAFGIPAAYTCVANRAALHDRVTAALTVPSPDTLRHCATLEETIFADPFAGLVHRAVADILGGAGGPLPTLPAPAGPDDRDRVVSEIAALIGRHPPHAQPLSALLQAVLAATPAP
ncbi:tetratricopeptide repeat protein [Streptomyces sp. NPDC058653]|uniref:tetratricopeptide repeat protein n=1 Tax=Streptomyces sp. NPDC058653 TaxID=3346576 RepID=UPI003655527E